MKVILVGGDQVGFFLIQELLDAGHDLTVIETRLEACEQLNRELDVRVFHGDGTHQEILEAAGARNADILVALTGKDENNLIACLVAKRKLNIPMTVAKVNNPKNREIFIRKGVDRSFSSTEFLVSMIEQEVSLPGMHIAFDVPGTAMQIVEFCLDQQSLACGQTLQDYRFPRNSKLVLLTHPDGQVELPRGDLQMQAGDRLLLICQAQDQEEVWKAMVQVEERK